MLGLDRNSIVLTSERTISGHVSLSLAGQWSASLHFDNYYTLFPHALYQGRSQKPAAMAPSSSHLRLPTYYADFSPASTGRNLGRHAGAHINKRALSAENIPYPPAPYTPTVALHAATLAPDAKDPSIPIQNTPGQPLSGVRTGPLVAALLAGTLLLLSTVITLVILVKSKRLRLPCSASRRRHRKSARYSRKSPAMSRKSSTGKEKSMISSTDDLFSRVSRVLKYSEKELLGDTHGFLTANSPEHSPTYEQIDMEEGLPPRRYSSPHLGYDRPSGMLSPESPTPRPLSLPGRELSSLIQKQRLAELAQIQRMKILQDDARSYRSTPPISRRSSMLNGLGIIHEELEVDVGNTNLANLQHYPFMAGETPSLTSAPFPAHTAKSESSPPMHSFESIEQMAATQSDPVSLETIQTNSSESLSSMMEAEDDIGEVRMARAESVEIKRGVLVSVHNSIISVPQFVVSTPSVRSLMSHMAMSPSNSSSLDFLSPNDIPPDSSANLNSEPSSDTIGRAITSFPSPPPMLGPITTSSFTFTAEIEEGLGGKVLDYRKSDIFTGSRMTHTTSREKQLLALAEALDFDKPTGYY
ncbi:hypothetical protein QCA50_009665 [Cerrena zonata]|uniref:Uncharacterized protein n=1 Tax=Cerrena zonata TaxID=2478898 RepID=A0AAW0GB82_9APHY